MNNNAHISNEQLEEDIHNIIKYVLADNTREGYENRMADLFIWMFDNR